MEKETSLGELLNELYRDKLELLKLMNIKAEICREYYLGLLDQGFNEIQALELCKNFEF